MEELPFFRGNPEDDVLLDDLTSRHVFPNNERHFGHLFDVEEFRWRNPEVRRQILEQIGGRTGFDPQYYEDKNTYVEDAVKCFDAHRRTIPCIDWHSDKKRIGNPTKLGWESGPKVYLCDFCPVRSTVDTSKRAKRGLYKE